jgi:thiamine-phosphate pyrophosphorylase
VGGFVRVLRLSLATGGVAQGVQIPLPCSHPWGAIPGPPLRTLWIFATLARMKHLFTAAALRAITQATGWSSRDDLDDLEAAALLMGIVAESDGPAAITLRRHGIDAQAVAGRWPALKRVASRQPRGGEQPARAAEASGEGMPIPPLSDDVQASLAALDDRLQRHPQSPALSTEHLLLGLAAARHEVAAWLREQGVDPDRLEASIRQPDVGPRGVLPSDEVCVLRVVDAAMNRGREGLRVVEDYVRFVLDDRHLTAQMKKLRHDLAAIGSRVSIDRRLAARETQGDVGTSVTLPSERSREGTRGVLVANFTRLEESLRTLEEFGKILDPDLAAEVKQLRYRAYTLQRAV